MDVMGFAALNPSYASGVSLPGVRFAQSGLHDGAIKKFPVIPGRA
jgi:hypothetical protein